MGRGRRGRRRSTVRAARVEIVDEAGRVRVVLGQLPGGAVGLTILDGDGTTCIYAALDPSGPAIALGNGGTVRAEVGVHQGDGEVWVDGPYAFLADPDGVPIEGLWARDTTDGL